MNCRLFGPLIIGMCLTYPVEVLAQTATAKDLDVEAAAKLAQDASPSEVQETLQITEVQLKSENGSLTLVLKTSKGELAQYPTQTEGNARIADIPNAVLALPDGQAFQAGNPAKGITAITVTQVNERTVRVSVLGTNSPPFVVMKSEPEGLILSLTSDEDTADSEEEITVTGKSISVIQSPVVSTSISREAFELRNNRRAGDVLDQLPGVLVEGPPGENKDVRLRGLDKEFTRIDVNGVTLPDGGEKREFRVNRLPSGFVEKIQVIRNPTADIESDGIAGRISLTTRPIPEKFILEGRAGYGFNRSNKSLWNAELVVGDKPIDQFGYLVGFSFLKEPLSIDKAKLFTNGKAELEKELKDVTSLELLGDLAFFYDQGEVHIKPLLSFQIEDKDKVKLNTEPKKDSVRDLEREEKDLLTVGFEITHKHKFKSDIRLETDFGYYVSSETKDKINEQFKQKSGVGAFALDKTIFEVEDKEDKIWNFATALTMPIKTGVKQEIKVGGAIRLRDRFRDKTKEDVDTKGKRTDTTTPKDNYFISEDYFALFVQDKIQVTDRFSITPGVRLEHVPRTTRDGTGLEGSTTDTDLNPSLHLLWNPIDPLTFRAAVSKGVNRPKFDELSPFIDERNDRVVIGSPDLAPARSLNFDIGGEYSTKHIFLGANFFYRSITGVIEEVDTGTRINNKRVFQVANVGNGSTSGFELEQRLNLGITQIKALEGLTLWANQTFLRSELTDFNGITRPFKDQPDFFANVGLDYTYKPWGTTFTISWGYVSDRNEFKADGTSKTIEAVSTLNLGLQQRLTDNLSLFFEASNLTNSGKTEVERGINNAVTSRKTEAFGRTFLLGVKWIF
jgi:outer membrane receptor protein involved in Fe transport